MQTPTSLSPVVRQRLLAVTEALRAFSTETVVAGKHAQQPNARLAGELSKRSAFMQPLEGSPYRDEI